MERGRETLGEISAAQGFVIRGMASLIAKVRHAII